MKALETLNEWLNKPSETYIGLFTCDILDRLTFNNCNSTFYRVFDGSQMKDVKSLMETFERAMPFFDGFGKNYYALRDCLCLDIQWEEDYNLRPPVVTPEKIVLVVRNAEYLLKDSVCDKLFFLQTIVEAGEYWKSETPDPDIDYDNLENVDVNRLIDAHKSSPFRLLLGCSTKDAAMKVKSSIDCELVLNAPNDKYRPIRYFYCDTDNGCSEFTIQFE